MVVAVLTNKIRVFYDYKNKNIKSKDTFIFVNSLENVRGRRFDKVEKLFGYEYISELDEILEYTQRHLKKEL